MKSVILLTGANGYIGSYLLNNLIGDYKIVAVSRSKPKLSCEWIQFKTLNDINLIETFRIYKPKYVLHCAAIAHKKLPFLKKNVDNLRVINVEYTKKLIEASLIYKPAKFIFISTAGVFSNKFNNIINERSEIEPLNIYSQLKLQSEKNIQDYFQNSSISWTIIRPPMIYGHKAPGNMNLLIKLIDFGIFIPLQRKSIKRNFLSINNLISAIRKIIDTNNSNNQIYIITDDEKITLEKLIKLISKLRNRNYLVFYPPRIFYKILKNIPFLGNKFKIISNEYIFDNSKIKNQLNWKPPFNFKSEFQKAYSKH